MNVINSKWPSHQIIIESVHFHSLQLSICYKHTVIFFLGITIKSTLILSDITAEVHTITIGIFADLQTMSHQLISRNVYNLSSYKLTYYSTIGSLDITTK